MPIHYADKNLKVCSSDQNGFTRVLRLRILVKDNF